MEYNVCNTCGAKDGHAGLLINGDCGNCFDTKGTGEITIHAHLVRTEEEIKKTFQILVEVVEIQVDKDES